MPGRLRATSTHAPPLPLLSAGGGLTVVAALSNRWGWERTGYRRKVVWAELALRVPPLDQLAGG
jgi:hypothetical protein